MSAPEKPRPVRLSLSDVLALLLTKPTRGEETVTLKANAKGDTQIEVTAREREGESLADVAERVSKVYDGLCELYPMSNGTPE